MTTKFYTERRHVDREVKLVINRLQRRDNDSEAEPGRDRAPF
jgi:hypothetical protein